MLKLVKDLRIGGVIKYYFADKDINQMQIPDTIRKCVAFIYCPTSEGRELLGTCFFVYEDILDTDRIFTYVVTAKHIIDSARSISIDNTVILRINLEDGTSTSISVDIDKWINHPTNFLDDISIVSFKSSKGFDIKCYPIKSIVDEKILKKEEISIGDETFVVGLFSKHHGETRNIPIIRVGNISAMPEEQIKIRNGTIDAYLIETRSFGGLSGSPVFVSLGKLRYMRAKGNVLIGGGYKFYLLGLIHGHWDWKNGEYDIINREIEIEAINMGIAIVTPATKILETINHPELLKSKEKQIEMLKKGNLPKEDLKKR